MPLLVRFPGAGEMCSEEFDVRVDAGRGVGVVGVVLEQSVAEVGRWRQSVVVGWYRCYAAPLGDIS